MATSTDAVAEALRDVNTVAVESAIRSNDPLPYFDEFHAADDAASEVSDL